jgi:L-fucose isomerase-like protein
MVVKSLKNLKIAQIGDRPAPYMSVVSNEAELIEKFGIQCVPISPTAIADQAEKLMANNDPELEAYYKEFTSRVDCSPMEKAAKDTSNPMSAMMKDGTRRTLAQTLAIRNAMQREGCACASLSCWPSSMIWKGTPCIAIGELASQGIQISCEGDIYGAITLEMLNACTFGEDPQFFADLTIRHPQNDNAELLWHCGPFPYALKDKDSKASLVAFNGSWELKKGNITICRFDSINGEYYLFAGEGKATDGPATTGTYVWFETDNWEQWEEKLVFGPYIHHVGGTYGNYLPVLREAARFLGLRFDTPGMAEVHSL